MYFDLDMNVVDRTPEKYPYSYDSFIIWISGYHKDKSKSIYSDRMFQWDSEKYNKCCKEVFGDIGQYFDNRDPVHINEFLNKYLGKDVKLTAILQECNRSSGFPYWRFIYEEIIDE